MNGNGFGPQTFNALYTYTADAGDVQATYLDFGPAIFAKNSCIVVYVAGNHNLYLFDDNNSALGPIIAGTNTTLSNSQCTLSGIGGLATPSGNNLTVPFNLTFKGAFAARQMIFGLAQSLSGTPSSWANFGTWMPGPAATLTAVSVSPVNGSGFGPQTFNAVYSETAGTADIQATYLDFGPAIFATHSCIVVYVTGNHTLYLFDDNNSSSRRPGH